MANRVTATINGYTATINAFNGDDVISVKTAIATKAFAERDAIKYCENNNLIFCEITELEKSNTVKVSMDSDYFYAHAVKMEKRPYGAYISRNVTVYEYEILVYSYAQRKARTITIKTDSDNTTVVERYAKRHCNANNEKLLKVNGLLNHTSALYVMSVDDFMKNGTIEE